MWLIKGVGKLLTWLINGLAIINHVNSHSSFPFREANCTADSTMAGTASHIRLDDHSARATHRRFDESAALDLFASDLFASDLFALDSFALDLFALLAFYKCDGLGGDRFACADWSEPFHGSRLDAYLI